jgi:hypothetical protein
VAILPIDMQAIILRMESISKYQQQQQEGVVVAQMVKGEELSRLAQLDSSRVNEVKPQPDGSNKIEEKGPGGKEKGGEGEEKGPEQGKKRKTPEFEDPFRGTIIDTVR